VRTWHSRAGRHDVGACWRETRRSGGEQRTLKTQGGRLVDAVERKAGDDVLIGALKLSAAQAQAVGISGEEWRRYGVTSRRRRALKGRAVAA